MKEKSLLTEKRKKQGLSMLALSKEADVAYTTVWNLENGLEARVSSKLKEKIAHVLEKNVWDVFPDVKRAMFKHIKEYEDLVRAEKQREIEKGVAFLITLEEITGGLEIKEEKEKLFYQKVLLRMTPDELGLYLFRSGTFPDDAKKTMRKFAKKYGIEFP